MTVNSKRIIQLNSAVIHPGPVAYWMSRDQRVRDNWALLFAQQYALSRKEPLLVVFCLVDSFLNASQRNYIFMLEGLDKVASSLESLDITFHILKDGPKHTLPALLKKIGAGCLVTDFDPLRIKRRWKDEVLRSIDIPFFEVDSHNIVPCRIASQKREFGARTIRPKLLKALPEYLKPFPKVQRHPYRFAGWKESRNVISRELEQYYQSASKWEWAGKAGEDAGLRNLRIFLKDRLDSYYQNRNDPSIDEQSGLSPYLHFGQLSAQRVALEIIRSLASKQSKDAFLEELIIRKELSDNFCFYNNNYDAFEGFPAWSQETLNKHRNDKREYNYSFEELEQAATHDALWNAAQTELVVAGKMHGYLRMYWAKKILEWTDSPEVALQIAIRLNDTYSLDGRDPNGYAGIAWSIGGVHDRAWSERQVFGKVRYMSYKGCQSKFDINAYIQKNK